MTMGTFLDASRYNSVKTILNFIIIISCMAFIIPTGH